jgi:predicted Zn-dependent protease
MENTRSEIADCGELSEPAERLAMPNDAKLGLVIGVGLVIAIGVIFYRKDAPTGSTAAIDKPSEVQTAERTQRDSTAIAKTTSTRHHTVQAGETLAGLARQYFGDEAKVAAIRELNPNVPEAGSLAVGTVLVLPDGTAGQ